MIRIATVEITPAAAIMRAFLSATRIQAAKQKKMYGIRVVITEIVASASNRLETRSSSPLATQPSTIAKAGVPAGSGLS